MNILHLNCNDKPGIVAAVSTALNNAQCNIEESSQYNDPLSGQFYMRVAFTDLEKNSLNKFSKDLNPIIQKFLMNWKIFDTAIPVRTAIMVSQHDHCLNDLLYRWRTNNLPIKITAIISNHKVTEKLAQDHDLPFHYLPITKDNKIEQETKTRNIIEQTESELIVLARYMQILSKEFCDDYSGRTINIHHSFLPGFKGAKPYHQAYERGVKIIGATAHFTTSDLDEGPIIVQDVEPIDHAYTPQRMKNLGQNTESRVLAQAINLYAERRIFLKERRTIIL